MKDEHISGKQGPRMAAADTASGVEVAVGGRWGVQLCMRLGQSVFELNFQQSVSPQFQEWLQLVN